MHLAYIWIVSHLAAKNYRNLWKFDEVLTYTNLLSFFWDTVYNKTLPFVLHSRVPETLPRDPVPASVSLAASIWVRHSGGPPFRGIIVIITLTLTLTLTPGSPEWRPSGMAGRHRRLTVEMYTSASVVNCYS